jgi:large conductance mechanosensitive channel
MKGFKDFILRGNLVELAVAFVMALAFAAVITATVNMLMDIVGKLGGTPDFSNWSPGGVSVGAFLTALISFVIVAAVVYFAIVMPYTKAKETMARHDAEEDPSPVVTQDVQLLGEIRDLIRDRATQL